VSLKVIGAGLGRTGTASLKLALEQLGIGRCYHMGEVGNNWSHTEKWLSAAHGNPDWDDIFKGFEATVDYPACNFWKELAEAYPEAKVILTMRNANDWFDSASATILSPKLIEWQKKSFLGDFIKKAVLKGIDEHVYERCFMIRHFEQHNSAVKQVIPNERLLVYEVKDEWEPLCNFLGLPIPDGPFPRVNSRKETEDLIKSVTAHPPEEDMDHELLGEYGKQMFTENRDKGDG